MCSNHGNTTEAFLQQMCRIRKLKSNEIEFFIPDKIYDSKQIYIPYSYKHCRSSYQNCMNIASSEIDKIINDSKSFNSLFEHVSNVGLRDIDTSTNEYIYDSFIEDIASYTLKQKLDTEHYYYHTFKRLLLSHGFNIKYVIYDLDTKDK